MHFAKARAASIAAEYGVDADGILSGFPAGEHLAAEADAITFGLLRNRFGKAIMTTNQTC